MRKFNANLCDFCKNYDHSEGECFYHGKDFLLDDNGNKMYVTECTCYEENVGGLTNEVESRN